MIEFEGWERQRVKPTLVDAVTNRLIYREPADSTHLSRVTSFLGADQRPRTGVGSRTPDCAANTSEERAVGGVAGTEVGPVECVTRWEPWGQLGRPECAAPGLCAPSASANRSRGPFPTMVSPHSRPGRTLTFRPAFLA